MTTYIRSIGVGVGGSVEVGIGGVVMVVVVVAVAVVVAVVAEVALVVVAAAWRGRGVAWRGAARRGPVEYRTNLGRDPVVLLA